MFGTTAIQADVEFVATGLGPLSADMQRIRSEVDRTYSGISTQTLKAAKIQDSYNRVLAKNSIESRAVRDATLRYRTEMAALDGQANRTSSALRNEEASFSRISRGALAGSGALGNLRRAAVFASSAFLGGFGLAYALKTVVAVAEEEQVAIEKLRASLHNAGLSWGEYGDKVETAVKAQERGSGFNRADISTALAANISRFGDVTKAIEQTAAAEDVARQKGISLADAQTLLQRASFGMQKSARTLGIDFVATSTHLETLRLTTKHATAEEIAAAKAADQHANRLALLAAIQARYHGDAARYLTTTAGKQQLFNAELKDTEGIIGTTLLPVFSRYLGDITDYLGKAKNQQKIQHDVNEAVHDAGIAFHTLKAILGPIAGAFHDVGQAAGGTKHEIELLTTAVILLWARARLMKWGIIAGGIKQTGTAAVVAEGEVAGLRGGLARLAGINPIVIPIVIAIYRKQIAGGLFHIPGYESLAGFVDKNVPILGQLDKAGGVAPDQIDPKHNKPSGLSDKPNPDPAKQAAADAAFAQIAVDQYGKPRGTKKSNGFSTANLTPKTGKGGGGSGYTPSGAAALRDNLARAEASGNDAEIRAAAAALLAYDQQAIAFVDKRFKEGRGTASLDEQRNQLYADEGSQRSTISGIDQAGAEKAGSAKRAAAEKARKVAANLKKYEADNLRARRATIARLEQIPDRLKAAVNLAKTAEEELVALKREAAALDQQRALLQRMGATQAEIAKNRLTASEVQKRIDSLSKKKPANTAGANDALFLSEVQRIISAYAPNAFGGRTGTGKAETHLFETVHELRGIKAHLQTVVGRAAFPASAFAGSAPGALAG